MAAITPDIFSLIARIDSAAGSRRRRHYAVTLARPLPVRRTLKTCRDLIVWWQDRDGRLREQEELERWMRGPDERTTRHHSKGLGEILHQFHGELGSPEDLWRGPRWSLGRPACAGRRVPPRLGQALAAARSVRPLGDPIHLEPELDTDRMAAPLVAGAYEYACGQGLAIPIDTPLDAPGGWPIQEYYCLEIERSGFDFNMMCYRQIAYEMEQDETMACDYSSLELPIYHDGYFENALGLLETLRAVVESRQGRQPVNRITVPEDGCSETQDVDGGGGVQMKMDAAETFDRHDLPACEGVLRRALESASPDFGFLTARRSGSVGDRALLETWRGALEAAAAYEGPGFLGGWDDAERSVCTGQGFGKFLGELGRLAEFRRCVDPLLEVQGYHGNAAVWGPLLHALHAESKRTLMAVFQQEDSEDEVLNNVGRTQSGRVERSGDRRGTGQAAPGVPAETPGEGPDAIAKNLEGIPVEVLQAIVNRERQALLVGRR